MGKLTHQLYLLFCSAAQNSQMLSQVMPLLWSYEHFQWLMMKIRGVTNDSRYDLGIDRPFLMLNPRFYRTPVGFAPKNRHLRPWPVKEAQLPGFKAWLGPTLGRSSAYYAHELHIYIYIYIYIPARTAQGGGGSFKDRKPIGEVDGCDAWMAEQAH